MSDQLFNQVQTRNQSVFEGLKAEQARVRTSINVLSFYYSSQPDPDEEELVKLLSQIIEDFDQTIRNALPDNFPLDSLLSSRLDSLS